MLLIGEDPLPPDVNPADVLELAWKEKAILDRSSAFAELELREVPPSFADTSLVDDVHLTLTPMLVTTLP